VLCRVRGFSGGLGLHGAFAGATPRSRGGHTRDVVCSAHAAQSSTVRMDNSIRLRYIGPASQRLFFPRKPYGTATCAYDSRLTFPLSSDGTSNNSKPRPRSGLRQELLPKQEQANLLKRNDQLSRLAPRALEARGERCIANTHVRISEGVPCRLRLARWRSPR
jgi:hypothetical protein